MLVSFIRPWSTPSATWARITALTLGLVVAIGLLELAAALGLVHWAAVFLTLRGEQQYFVPDADLAFRHTPGTRWSGQLRSDIEVAGGLPASRTDRITLTYDRRGYRNPTELPRADIVLIGDSYIEGAYVSDDQVLSRLLETRLGRPVANLGVAGFGAAQELVVLKGDAAQLEPDVVVWFFFEGNDLYDDQVFENTLLVPREIRGKAWTRRQGWWRRSFIRSAHRQLRLMLYPLVPIYYPHFATLGSGPHRDEKILFAPDTAFPWTEFEQERWERAKQTLGEAVTITRTHNAKLLLVYIPTKFRVYRDFIKLLPSSRLRDWTLWPLPEFFAEFCRTSRIACLDLTASLQESVRNGGMPYARTDSHWSPEGHRVVATRVEQMLRSLRWIPPQDPTSSADRQDAGVS